MFQQRPFVSPAASRSPALRVERKALRSETQRSTLSSRPSRALRGRWAFAAAVALIAATLAAWTSAAELDPPGAAEALRRHVQYLASPELTGRGVDTPGINLARDYIATEFAKAGLKPGGDNGSYLQGFDVAVGVTVSEPSSLALRGDMPLQLNSDWTPLGLSKSDKIHAPIVFAGYGITAKEYGYDDYAGIDARGTIVLVLRYEPPPQDEKSPFKKLPGYSNFAALRTKANNAREHGAVGMILVDMNPTGDQQTELISTQTSLWRGGNSVVAAQVKQSAIEKWLEARGISLKALKKKIDGSGKPASMAIREGDAALEVNLREDRRRVSNVIGVLPGADSKLKNQSIVIGAHYDHLGFGHFGAIDREAEGKIHPGADDNASGTAVLLELARRLGHLPIKPARTIIFVAFSAEELGLYGSRYYVDHPTAPAAMDAMLNLDMVGRLRDNRITIFGARSGAGLSEVATRAAGRLGLEINQSDDVGRSDHRSFYTKKIPVLHFFTGNHADYHRATDTWDKLNIEGMARVTDLVLSVALEIADARDPVRFVSLLARSSGNSASATGLRTYLGTMPDYGVASDGVRLAGVSDGSPAARAGLREGDVIIRLAEKKIQNIEDLTDALGAHKAGDQVEITVLRDGQQIILKATLSSRG